MAAPILSALYLRASTDEQTESIPAQQMLLKRYAKDHNYQIVAEYQDQGKSGDSFQIRTGLQELLADAKAGKFQQVLVRNLSRLSRRNSLKTAAQIIAPLLDAGVGVCTASQGNLNLDTATGRIVLAVLSEMENTENSSRAFNVLCGILKSASEGYWVSNTPLGYRIVGPTGRKELQLGDPHTVELIRRIYQLYTQGESLRGIARLLNSEGHRSPGGKQWCCQTIMRILSNPVYCGDHRYNLRSRGKYYQIQGSTLVERRQHWREDRDGTLHVTNGSTDWIYHRDRWPAIVERATWDAAQARLVSNRKQTAPNREYLFSGLLRCSCGHANPMWGHKNGIAQKQRRYICQGCSATCNEQELLERVTETIQQQHSLADLEQMRQAIERKVRKQLQTPTGQALKPIEDKLRRYEARLLECSSDMVAIVEQEIRNLRQQLQDAQRQQRAAQHSQQELRQIIDRALQDFFDLPKAIKRKTPAQVRRYLQQVLDRVEVRIGASGHPTRKRYHLVELDIIGQVKPVLSTSLNRSQPPHGIPLNQHVGVGKCGPRAWDGGSA